jgi:NAD-dependent SIR2 family protein deacetylase
MTKLECNYCESAFEVSPINAIADEGKVCYCPYCGSELDEELDFEDSEYEFEDE